MTNVREQTGWITAGHVLRNCSELQVAQSTFQAQLLQSIEYFGEASANVVQKVLRRYTDLKMQ